MSVDYYLYSKKANRAVMIGSNGFSGVKSWPVEYGGREFIAWAIDNSIDDVCIVNEDQLPEGVENVTKYQEK